MENKWNKHENDIAFIVRIESSRDIVVYYPTIMVI